MKHDCCVLAPDLRGHGLTSSTGTEDTKEDTTADTDTREGDHGDDDHGEGDSDDGSTDGADALMSLESLAEDVTSLLVEIFTRGLLSQRQQQQGQPCHQQQPLHTAPLPPVSSQTPPIADSSAESGSTPVSTRSTSSNKSSVPARCSAATGGADPPVRGLEDTNKGSGGGGSSSSSAASHEPRVRGGSSPANSLEILPANPVKLLLVGHSLGGSIAVRVAGAAEELKRRCKGGAEVAGLVAVDVVEGTALASLDDMPEVSA